MRGAAMSHTGTMNTQRITETLIAKGRSLWELPGELVRFTGNPEADRLLNDLEATSHAFVLACIMDRQVKAEKAWLVPYLISQKLDSFEFQVLAGLGVEEIIKLMTIPQPLHRFPEQMAKNLYAAIQLIAEKYNGKASTIWQGKPSSAEVVYRFLEFRGVGPKIATMATNILARDFKVRFSDYYSIDMSIDVHVRRVFSRLGLVPQSATNEQIIYRARALSPEFPGLLDLPAWEIGRSWCRPSEPNCAACYMNELCPKID